MTTEGDKFDLTGASIDTFFTVLSILLLVIIQLYERRRKKFRHQRLIDFEYTQISSFHSSK